MKMTQEEYDALWFAIRDIRYWENGELRDDMVKLAKEAVIVEESELERDTLSLQHTLPIPNVLHN